MTEATGKLVGEFVIPAQAPCFDTGFEIQPNRRYRFLAKGTWIDLKPPAIGPDGVSKPGGLREFVNWAKRLPTAPWMALLMRTRGTNGTSDWRLLGGRGDVLSDLPAGRLQMCANDVPGFYWNNRGSLNVSVFDCGHDAST